MTESFLTGPNTYSGGTTVSGGTLIAAASGALGSGDVTIDNAATLRLQGTGLGIGSRAIDLLNSGSVYFEGGASAETATLRILPGSGFGDGVRFMDSSTAGSAQILNSYGSSMRGVYFLDSATAGNATITNRNAAVTNFRNTSSAGSATIINETDGQTFFSGRSSAGSSMITNRATGSVYFTGSATGASATIVNEGGGRVDVSGGTAGTSIGSLSGAGNVFLGNRSLTLGALGKVDTISGGINGTGALIKSGTGQLILSGNSAGFSGSTRVTAGTLVVNDSLANSVVTVDSGLLGGTGIIGGFSVQSRGAVAPGNSIGRLTVAGDVAFALGSIYRVEVNAAGEADRIAATGKADLAGGRVQVQAETGSYQPSTRYTILTANSGVRGTFAGVSSNFAYLDPTLTYDPTAVNLILSRKTDSDDPDQPSAFHPVAETRNQYDTADAVEALGSGNRVFQAVVGQSVSGARQAFDALSGEAHASAASVAFEDGWLVRDAILTRLRQPLLASSVPTFARGTYAATYAVDRPDTTPEPVGLSARSAVPSLAFWGEGFGSWGRAGSNGNAANLETSTGGFILGADAQINPAFRIGLAGGFTNTSFNVDDRLSSGSNDNVFGALYGSGS